MTFKELKEQIENANALGVANLAEKGIMVNDNATTYEIMDKIADIVGNGGVEYESIVYNEDDSITLNDKDGIVHTIECEYINGKLTSVKYDGKVVKLTYEGDLLTKVGKTAVDLTEYISIIKEESGMVFFDMGDGFISGEPCSKMPFEKAKFYTVTIDGVDYRAGSSGYSISTDVRDSVHLCIMYDEELGTLMYMVLPQDENDFAGVHSIKISERNTEEIGWQVLIDSLDYWYFLSNDFEVGEVINVRVIDENGVEYWNSEGANKIFSDESEFCLGFKGRVYASDMQDDLREAIADGKKITFILKQTINGVTTEKTYGGTTYDFYYENPFNNNYLYGFGNDYISVAEARSS